MKRLAIVACLLVAFWLSADEKGESKGRVSGIDKSWFSKTVKPGDDFYLYTNGTWLEKTEIPADRSNYSMFMKINDENEAALRKIVESAAKADSAEGTEEQQVGDFFLSYTNMEARNKRGVKPIARPIQAISKIKNKGQLASIMGRNQRNGVSNPFTIYVNQDAKKTSQYIVYVTQSGISMPDRDYYLNDEPRFKRYREALQAYAKNLLTKVGYEHAERASKVVLELETKLAQGQWSRVETRNAVKSYNKMSHEEVASLIGEFAWDRYIKAAKIDQQTHVIVRQPTFIKAFGKVFDETSLDDWKDYYAYRVANAYSTSLNEELDKLSFEFFQKTLRGVGEPQPIWKRAINNLNDILGEALGKIYVKERFQPEAKERMQQLVDNLKKACKQRILQLKWMGEGTKKQALLKLSKFTTKIGYPDKWKDYSKLKIVENDLVGNLRRASVFQYQEMIDKLGKPVDRGEWHMNPQTVNAYYNPLMNEIVFPAAILQPPFFNLEADDAVNYGAIGAAIGHEISHGFDDQGSRYDGDGNLRNWWTKEDRVEFEKRAKKLVEQYSAYKPLDDIAVNGELTLGENIGDLGGLNMTYAAYRLSLEGKPAPVIDGLTGDQRFFLGYAQIWKRKYRPAELRRRLLADVHSPGHYRTIGIVSNMEAFYKAFDIKPGSKMYIAPDKRVKIW